MKTFLQRAAALALLALGLSAGQSTQAQSAVRPQPVCVDQVGDFSYLIRVSNPSRLRGEVQLVNASDKVVHYQQYSRKHVFGGRLNVRELSDGQYALRVKLGKAVYHYTLDIHSSHNRVARLGAVSTTALAIAD